MSQYMRERELLRIFDQHSYETQRLYLELRLQVRNKSSDNNCVHDKLSLKEWQCRMLLS